MALKTNLVIDQGSDFSANVTVYDGNNNPIDLTSYSANAQIRKWYTSSNSYALTTNLHVGAVTLSMNATATGTIDFGRYVYDVVINDGSNNITRVAEGIVTVTPSVTR